jgi:hypothetical protein
VISVTVCLSLYYVRNFHTRTSAVSMRVLLEEGDDSLYPLLVRHERLPKRRLRTLAHRLTVESCALREYGDDQLVQTLPCRSPQRARKRSVSSQRYQCCSLPPSKCQAQHSKPPIDR